MELTFKLVDGLLVAAVDPKQAEEIGFETEARFVVVKTPDGYVMRNADLHEDLALIDDIMAEDHDVLQRLSQ